jgi:hypothetical protein
VVVVVAVGSPFKPATADLVVVVVVMVAVAATVVAVVVIVAPAALVVLFSIGQKVINHEIRMD